MAGRLWLFVIYSCDGITANGTRKDGRYKIATDKGQEDYEGIFKANIQINPRYTGF